MPRASSWVRERRAIKLAATQPASLALPTATLISREAKSLSPREHLYASVGDDGLFGRYGSRVSGKLLLAVQRFEEARKARAGDVEALERAYHRAWAHAEVGRGVSPPRHEPLFHTLAFLLDDIDRLNARWQRGLELDRMRWNTLEAEEKAFQTFRAIAAEAEEVWDLLEVLAPDQLKDRYFLEPIEDDTEPSAA